LNRNQQVAGSSPITGSMFIFGAIMAPFLWEIGRKAPEYTGMYKRSEVQNP